MSQHSFAFKKKLKFTQIKFIKQWFIVIQIIHLDRKEHFTGERPRRSNVQIVLIDHHTSVATNHLELVLSDFLEIERLARSHISCNAIDAEDRRVIALQLVAHQRVLDLGSGRVRVDTIDSEHAQHDVWIVLVEAERALLGLHKFRSVIVHVD